MTNIMIILLVIGGIAAVAALWFISTFNKLVHLKALIEEAWSGIDVQLKRRYDLIPNLIQVVKQYASHEKGIFEEVARMRAASMQSTTIDQKVEAEKGLTGALKTLFAVVENYPTLKANENFMSLQKELSNLEHEIQLTRRYYNGASRNYNILTQSFPSRIVASYAGFEKVSYFELASIIERENPRVQF
jgi:LemA protein